MRQVDNQSHTEYYLLSSVLTLFEGLLPSRTSRRKTSISTVLDVKAFFNSFTPYTIKTLFTIKNEFLIVHILKHNLEEKDVDRKENTKASLIIVNIYRFG